MFGSLFWLRTLRATQLWHLPSLNLESLSVIHLLLLLLWWSLRRMWTSAFGCLGQHNPLEHPSSETGPLFPTNMGHSSQFKDQDSCSGSHG